MIYPAPARPSQAKPNLRKAGSGLVVALPFPLLAKLNIVNLNSKTHAPDRVLSCQCRIGALSCHVRLDREGSHGARAHALPPKKKKVGRVDDDTRHVRLFVRRAEKFHQHRALLPTPAPLSFIQGDERRTEGEREGKRARAKNHAEDGSFAMPAPGVRERLRISFNSAQRLTRAASESPPPPPSVVGGWDTTLRAVGLGGGDGSRRSAPS